MNAIATASALSLPIFLRAGKLDTKRVTFVFVLRVLFCTLLGVFFFFFEVMVEVKFNLII